MESVPSPRPEETRTWWRTFAQSTGRIKRMPSPPIVDDRGRRTGFRIGRGALDSS